MRDAGTRDVTSLLWVGPMDVWAVHSVRLYCTYVGRARALAHGVGSGKDV